MSISHLTAPETRSTALLWDHQDIIPLKRSLEDEDLVLLLTPAVAPLDNTSCTSDPFEPLGQALARVHPWIRHVPYTKERGLSGVHVAFIKRAKVVIFVLSGISADEGAVQLDLADATREVCEDRPIIFIACCRIPDNDLNDNNFPTLFQSVDYSVPDLESIASLVMNKQAAPTGQPLTFVSVQNLPALFSVQLWDYERDLTDIHALWTTVFPPQFHLSQPALGLMLKRDGYALHHVVRDPKNMRVIGFCATFTTFADSSGDRLIGSLAILIVGQEFRGRGVGRMLHEECLSKLNKIRGVGRIQIGTTFPRLLYGIPANTDCLDWFQRRGWQVNEATPGKGRPVSDWLLRFVDRPLPSLASAGLTFRPCQITDIPKVIEMASRESERKFGFGWYDQYTKTVDSHYMSDVIVGLEGDNLVAAAITYLPNSGSPCSTDIPWPAAIGQDIGGISCICIKDDDPDMANRRDSVATRLLQSCRQSLSRRGMIGIFVDGVKLDENVLVSLGFSKWADYKEVWRKV